MKTMGLLLGVILLSSAPLAFSQQRELIQIDRKASITPGVETPDNAGANSQTQGHDDQYGIQLFPKRGGDLDWGLALSGGGVRAAAFSIGAMKALFDKEIMRDIDVISSVSGGSYASYWLFTNYEKNKTQEFGHAAFNNDLFIQNVCELQKVGRSNPVHNKDYLRMIIKQVRGKRAEAFDDYKKAIELSFGNVPWGGVPTEKPLDFLTDKIADAPYFIINTTVRLSDKDKKRTEKLKYESSRVFEISPHFRGNPFIGFSDWTQGDKDNPSLSKSIAMSGAQEFFDTIGIRGDIKNFNEEVVAGEKLYLKDGGFSENLGALALIRRGIKNVIIIDAEADPAYKFDAYLKLKEMLAKELKINFCVPDIESFLGTTCNVEGITIPAKVSRKDVFSASPVSEGKAVRKAGEGTSIDTHIYYIKMSLPEAILPETFLDVDKCDKKCDAITEGQKIENERQCDLCPGAKPMLNRWCQDRPQTSKCDCKNKVLDCTKINLTLGTEGYKNLYKNLYTNIVWSYSKYLNNPTGLWLRAVTKSFNAAGRICYFLFNHSYCSVLSYNFPHITTFDQSYFSDQLEAFVGLGYLQAMKLEKRTDNRDKSLSLK
jgi:Patatin-like phospholipase